MRNKFLGTVLLGLHPMRKLRIILAGLRHAIPYDLAVTYKMVLSSLILRVCSYYHQWLDFGLIFVATGVMLVAEMFNTTIEALCDFLESPEDRKIGIIKDIAAAAAGISILVWCVVLALELLLAWQLRAIARISTAILCLPVLPVQVQYSGGGTAEAPCRHCLL